MISGPENSQTYTVAFAPAVTGPRFPYAEIQIIFVTVIAMLWICLRGASGNSARKKTLVWGKGAVMLVNLGIDILL